MKRDMKLVRLLLQQIEEAPAVEGVHRNRFTFDGTDDDIVSEHISLLLDEQLVTRTSQMHVRLTWKGHDFIEAANATSVTG